MQSSAERPVRTYMQLYKVHADGSGLPERLPLPSAFDGSFSADGTHLAYNPFLQWEGDSWKRYRGGQTQPVWLIDLKTLDVVKVPRDNSNDAASAVDRRCSLLSFRSAMGRTITVPLRREDKAVEAAPSSKGLDFQTLGGRGEAAGV